MVFQGVFQWPRPKMEPAPFMAEPAPSGCQWAFSQLPSLADVRTSVVVALNPSIISMLAQLTGMKRIPVSCANPLVFNYLSATNSLKMPSWQRPSLTRNVTKNCPISGSGAVYRVGVMWSTRYSEREPMRIFGPQMPRPELM